LARRVITAKIDTPTSGNFEETDSVEAIAPDIIVDNRPMLFLAVLLASQTAFARPELLVDATWLAAHLNDPNVRIVDLRPRGYGDGHIPGAVWLDNNAIRVARRPPTFLPSPAEFAELMATLGISNTTRVIAYDERGGIYAARLWWILNYYGHSNVALLDGGWTKWTLDQRPVDKVAPAVARTTFRVQPGSVKVATADDVKGAIGKTGVKLVDARTQAEIEGKDLRNIRRGGYIESSVPVYWEDTLDPATKTFRSPAAIQKLYRDRGIQPKDEVITYCQVGMRAAHNLFTLALIGHDLTKLGNYYGSWEEWGNRDDTPIQKK
jgi:thiosulfate/3-mercaptopyruvate sulfurtransferase